MELGQIKHASAGTDEELVVDGNRRVDLPAVPVREKIRMHLRKMLKRARQAA
jgi:hypothetical protein